MKYGVNRVTLVGVYIDGTRSNSTKSLKVFSGGTNVEAGMMDELHLILI